LYKPLFNSVAKRKLFSGIKSIGGGRRYFSLASLQVRLVELRFKYKIIYIATSFVYFTSVYCEISK
jgi:hypothetical protein